MQKDDRGTRITFQKDGENNQKITDNLVILNIYYYNILTAQFSTN